MRSENRKIILAKYTKNCQKTPYDVGFGPHLSYYPWFYGLKLHLIINPKGGLVKASFSSGNKDDRKHFSSMVKDIFGKVVGDRGYISKGLFNDLFDKNI